MDSRARFARTNCICFSLRKLDDQGRLVIIIRFAHDPHAITVAEAVKGCYPTRMKLLNYINVPGYANLFLELTKLFLNKKLRERFHFYSRQTAHDCFKDMPVNILPVEYGGTDEYWKKVIEENREWLINDEKYRPVLN
ncbi:uncharacterized protein LOC114937027 isoform X1 [Nylanderia fulva]|uniref:uncharacterized protein LOC114937027 isoform X1 n=1 Tax=Nylanderia fulva TaxID=613905 RepID=UPI0010FB7E47|nr:uncharacterized protein LOC114937027 isoform X1 [Nylanderia fulva]